MGLLRTPPERLFRHGLRRWSASMGTGVLTLAAVWSGGAASGQESVLFPEPGARYDLFAAESSGGAEREGAGEAETDEIETDRDSFTPATTTTPVGRVIFESAYSFIDNRDTLASHRIGRDPLPPRASSISRTSTPAP